MKKKPHKLTTNVKLLQKAVLVYNGQFLILKRSEDSATRAGKWDLPGGNSEWPNVKSDTRSLHLADLVREVAEETGIAVDQSSISATSNVYIDTYFEAQKQVFTIILGWKIELDSQPDVVISDEHTKYAWISLDEFDQYDFGFAGESDGFIREMMVRANEKVRRKNDKS